MRLTDSSSHKGAVVSREVPNDVIEALWLSGDRRGHYTRLDSHVKELRAIVGDPDDLHSFEEFQGVSPVKQPDFIFDFVEICGGSKLCQRRQQSWASGFAPPSTSRALLILM